MMARSRTRSNQRPDTLMQDRICQVDETSCNARPDHTSGSQSEELTMSTCFPLCPRTRTLPDAVGTSHLCHVWTAPVWQELSSRFCSIGRCSHVFGLLMRFT